MISSLSEFTLVHDLLIRDRRRDLAASETTQACEAYARSNSARRLYRFLRAIQHYRAGRRRRLTPYFSLPPARGHRTCVDGATRFSCKFDPLPAEPLAIPTIDPKWLLELCEYEIAGTFRISATLSADRTKIPRISARLIDMSEIYPLSVYRRVERQWAERIDSVRRARGQVVAGTERPLQGVSNNDASAVVDQRQLDQARPRD